MVYVPWVYCLQGFLAFLRSKVISRKRLKVKTTVVVVVVNLVDIKYVVDDKLYALGLINAREK
jgi:hypothetical protein